MQFVVYVPTPEMYLVKSDTRQHDRDLNTVQNVSMSEISGSWAGGLVGSGNHKRQSEEETTNNGQ